MQRNKEVAVVTGGAQGLGLAIVKACLAQQMHVVVMDCNEQRLSQLSTTLASFEKQVLYFAHDVRETMGLEEIAALSVSQFGRIDWLFNNAAIVGETMPLWALSDASFNAVMDVNLLGALRLVRAFMPHLLKQSHRSRIINIASVYGLCPTSLKSAYAISKHALVSFSECLQFDLERLGAPVDVSVVCPSYINTGLVNLDDKAIRLDREIAKLMRFGRSPEAVAQKIIDGINANQFYIFPDYEIKELFEQHAAAILQQAAPPPHALEKLIRTIAERVEKIEV